MSAEQEGKSRNCRAQYRKPELRVVELAADEVLAQGCKTSAGGNNVGTVPCPGGPCAKNKQS